LPPAKAAVAVAALVVVAEATAAVMVAATAVAAEVTALVLAAATVVVERVPAAAALGEGRAPVRVQEVPALEAARAQALQDQPVAPPQAEPAALAARRQPALPPTPPCRAPASWPHRRQILLAVPHLWAPAALLQAPELILAPGQQTLPASMAANRDSRVQPASVLLAGRRPMSSGQSISIRRCTRALLIA